MERSKFFSAKRITGMAVLLALVIVLQLFGGYFRIGATQLSFVLVPIVLGGILYGPIASGILGFAFGLVVLLQGVFGVDVFTLTLFTDHPFWTSALCLVKGTAAGVVSGLLYKLLAKKNVYVGVFVAAASAPIVNTGLFILGSLCFLQDTLKANFVNGQTVIYFLIIGCAGINFLIELAINLVASPAIYRVVTVIQGKIDTRKKVSQKRKNAIQIVEAEENTQTTSTEEETESMIQPIIEENEEKDSKTE